MDLVKTFVKGRMNKSLDERLIPDGEYIDAMNVRVGSTELSDIGSLENTKGNTKISEILYNGEPLAVTAACIGAFQDGVNDTIYWFIHSPEDGVDMIVSINVETGLTVYHVVSTSVLNFSRQHLINGVNKIEDLLFFTDGYNPPRKINVKRSYPSEPDLTESDISVIVAPPASAPSIELINIYGEENYIKDKFLSFAYRYKYEDGEYSAVSQFSEIAFEPGFFNFDFSTYQNAGMQNSFNAVNISFNTGGSNVVGIDLLYKTSVSSVINVIQKYDKISESIPNNVTLTKIFDSKRIFTTLPESEILRTFDNVPLVAKSQTLMSNRIFYGNYKDGNDLIDYNGKQVNVDLVASLKEEEIGYTILESDLNDSTYNISGLPITEGDSKVTIDFTGIQLKAGGAIGIDFSMQGSLINITNVISQTFLFELQRDYSSIYDLATSQDFIDAIGSLTFHKEVSDCGTVNEGFSLTDKISCEAVPPSGYTKIGYGIDTLGEGIKIIATPGSAEMSLQMIAIVYEKDSDPSDKLYEYFTISFSDAQYAKVSDSSSLHSNRDFSVGIIYMDDYNRSTTVLTSDNNSIHIPAKNSILKNTFNVKINSTPPYWAKRYKFALMPSGLDYETVYSTIYFTDSTDGSAYIKLEGDNQNKVKVGDTLIVKSDSNGYLSNLVKCTVLDIEAKGSDFIQGGQKEPAGLYMKLMPSGWAITERAETVKGGDSITTSVTNWGLIVVILAPTTLPFYKNKYPVALYPLFEENPDSPNNFIPYDVPEGSILEFDIIFNRPYRSNQVGQRRYIYKKRYVAASDYASIYDFVISQNIRFDTGESFESGDEVANENLFINTIGTVAPLITGGVNKYQFIEQPLGVGETGSKLSLVLVGGTPSRFKTESTITMSVKLIRQNSILVFETEPTESVPAIYFEGDQVFDIISNSHSETDIDLTFTDCFTFGNGVESYKINDGLADPYFRLGQRVSSVSDQDFKLADRFSSLTYSGIFNPETNINKLNEFNLGLANFKDLERRFGSIQKISGRQTDILVLQEDKISYVLAGKNVLSDAAAGGGAIAAVPEVLGNQIARIEEYGISLNPESYVEWGFEKYFTDQKRGSVIRLTGAGTNEDLSVISNEGMRSWFRDLFINDGKTQKLGGYDPYMAEYVLSSNEIDVEQDVTTIGCGTEIQIRNGEDGLSNTIVELGEYEGLVSISVEIDGITPTKTIKVDFVYDGVTYTSGNIEVDHVFTFNKTSKDTGVLSVTQTADVASYRIIVGCPEVEEITVISVTVNDKSYEGKVITDEYSVGTSTSGKLVSMLGGNTNPIVSNYSSISGPEGFGAIPSDGNTVVIRSVKGSSGTMQFNPATHKLRYLMSNTLYTQANVLSLLNASTVASPVLNPTPGVYSASFTYNSGSDYLYIIHDYRNIYSEDLCYSSVSANEACCECEPL